MATCNLHRIGGGADNITLDPINGLTSNNVQDAIRELNSKFSVEDVYGDLTRNVIFTNLLFNSNDKLASISFVTDKINCAENTILFTLIKSRAPKENIFFTGMLGTVPCVLCIYGAEHASYAGQCMIYYAPNYPTSAKVYASVSFYEGSAVK